jgi:hypothetical protein
MQPDGREIGVEAGLEVRSFRTVEWPARRAGDLVNVCLAP